MASFLSHFSREIETFVYFRRFPEISHMTNSELVWTATIWRGFLSHFAREIEAFVYFRWFPEIFHMTNSRTFWLATIWRAFWKILFMSWDWSEILFSMTSHIFHDKFSNFSTNNDLPTFSYQGKQNYPSKLLPLCSFQFPFR